MRIGLNLLYLIPNKVGGTETYARGLINALLKVDKKNDYYLFCNKENANTFTTKSNFHVVVVPIHATNRFIRILSEQLLLPIYALIYRLDLLHSLGYTTPILVPCRSIVTIHDLNWHYHPEDFFPIEYFAWKFFVMFSAKCSDTIISVSQSTALSLITVLHIPKNKIITIYSGVIIRDIKNKKLPHELNKYAPYLFTVSASYPHKNLITLLKVFNKIKTDYPQLNLLIVGLKGKASNEIMSFIDKNNLNKRVIILGYVTNALLKKLYCNAKIFVFPSAYEGFGFPVLEAMAHKIPVVSSNAFSLKEIGSPVIDNISPFDVNTYIKSIKKILDDDTVNKNLVLKYRKHIKKFTWVNTARKHLLVYNY